MPAKLLIFIKHLLYHNQCLLSSEYLSHPVNVFFVEASANIPSKFSYLLISIKLYSS